MNHLAFGPGERKVIGRNTGDPARWKRYRGGTAGHLWIDADGAGTFRRMNELKGNLTSPMWIGERIWFLSDFEGVANLYSCRPDGWDLRRHTEHDDFYARHAQTDGQRIVYQCGADLWLFDPARDRATRIEVRTPSHQTQAARRFVPAAEHLGGFYLHPAGHSVAIDARGKLFTMALWEGAVRQHGAGRRGRCGSASGWRWHNAGRGQRRVRRGAHHRVRERRGASLPWELGCVTALRAAPLGTLVAIANHRNEVWIGDVASGGLSAVDAATSAAATTWPGRPTARGSHTRSPPARATPRSSCTRSARTHGAARWSRSPSSTTTARRSTPRASTSTSCRCAPSTRSTTACTSSWASRAPRGPT